MISLGFAHVLFPSLELGDLDLQRLLIVYPLKGLSNEPDVAGQIKLLDEDLMRIGRQTGCQIQIKEQFISRIHAHLYRLPDNPTQVFLRDGDQQGKPSSNGVFVNGSRLREPHGLVDGDWIQLGSRMFASFHEIRIPTEADQHHQTPLADLLVETGLLSLAAVRAAQKEGQHQGQLFGEILIRKGLISSQTLTFLNQIDTIRVPIQAGKPPVGEYLKAAGLATEKQILEAMQIQKRTHVYFGNTLVNQGHLPKPLLDLFLRRYGHLDPSNESTIAIGG